MPWRSSDRMGSCPHRLQSASVYPATRFEFYFRLLSGKLTAEGCWVSRLEQDAALARLGDRRLRHSRISNLSLAYRLMKLGTSRVVPYCESLDRVLYPSPTAAVGNFEIANIGDRIAFGRRAAGHGHWGDISAEAVFYGLMTAVIFYAQ